MRDAQTVINVNQTIQLGNSPSIHYNSESQPVKISLIFTGTPVLLTETSLIDTHCEKWVVLNQIARPVETSTLVAP